MYGHQHLCRLLFHIHHDLLPLYPPLPRKAILKMSNMGGQMMVVLRQAHNSNHLLPAGRRIGVSRKHQNRLDHQTSPLRDHSIGHLRGVALIQGQPRRVQELDFLELRGIPAIVQRVDLRHLRTEREGLSQGCFWETEDAGILAYEL